MPLHTVSLPSGRHLFSVAPTYLRFNHICGFKYCFLSVSSGSSQKLNSRRLSETFTTEGEDEEHAGPSASLPTPKGFFTASNSWFHWFLNG